jgi:hypothetical protein
MNTCGVWLASDCPVPLMVPPAPRRAPAARPLVRCASRRACSSGGGAPAAPPRSSSARPRWPATAGAMVCESGGAPRVPGPLPPVRERPATGPRPAPRTAPRAPDARGRAASSEGRWLAALTPGAAGLHTAPRTCATSAMFQGLTRMAPAPRLCAAPANSDSTSTPALSDWQATYLLGGDRCGGWQEGEGSVFHSRGARGGRGLFGSGFCLNSRRVGRGLCCRRARLIRAKREGRGGQAEARARPRAGSVCAVQRRGRGDRAGDCRSSGTQTGAKGRCGWHSLVGHQVHAVAQAVDERHIWRARVRGAGSQLDAMPAGPRPSCCPSQMGPQGPSAPCARVGAPHL